MQLPGRGGKKVYIFGPGHMTKMATMPMYGKNLKKSSFSDCLKTWFVAFGELFFKDYINNDPGLNLTYFMARPNLVH